MADAAVAATALAGRTLAELMLRQEVGVNVVGVWDRGSFRLASSTTRIQASSVLLFTGVQADLARHDELFQRVDTAGGDVLVLGGGEVGHFVARTLAEGLSALRVPVPPRWSARRSRSRRSGRGVAATWWRCCMTGTAAGIRTPPFV